MFTGHSINWAGLLVPTGGSNSAIQRARSDTPQTVAVNSGGPREFRGGQLVGDPATGAPACHLYFLRTGPFLGQTRFILCSHVPSFSVPYSLFLNQPTLNVEYECSFLALVITVMNLQFHEWWSVPWRTDSLPASEGYLCFHHLSELCTFFPQLHLFVGVYMCRMSDLLFPDTEVLNGPLL